MTNDPIQTYREFDEKDPAYQVRLLAFRVDVLVKEKEDLELRVLTMEKSLGKGAGILIGLASVGTLSGVLIAYGNKIFGPWIRQ